MSYHILHITTPNCYLSVDKGLLFCKYDDDSIKSIAIADLKAIIAAGHGISFSNNCLARLMENNVVILHCNSSYQPTGWSVPLERIVRTSVFYNQIAQNEKFETQLWKQILKSKVLNQASNLDLMGCEDHGLMRLINRPLMNEANIAKQYWQKYFSVLGTSIKREHQNAQTFENACLNYGYAVLNTLIYRSIIVHGLIAGLGIHHKGKYKSTPLVYDLMECYRAFIDFYFYKFATEYSGDYKVQDFKRWFQFLADCMKNYRLEINGTSYKLVDTIDIYIEKIVDAYINYDSSGIFLPDIKQQSLFVNKHRNREYEE